MVPSDCDSPYTISETKCVEIFDEELHMIGSDICALQYLQILKIAGCKLAMILPELGLLSLTELVLSSNLLGLCINWDWLKGKPLMNSLRKLDLSSNQLHFFPPQLVRYEKLVNLSLKRNEITVLPFGIRRMRGLRFFDVSMNLLVSLPSSYFQLYLDSMNIFGNPFLPRKEHNFICALFHVPLSTYEPKPFNGSPNDIVPLWLQAVRVVSDKQLAFSYKTLPPNLVDLLLELPKCACGKICDKNKVYERAVKARYPSNVCIDIVLCGNSCQGMLDAISSRWHFRF